MNRSAKNLVRSGVFAASCCLLATALAADLKVGLVVSLSGPNSSIGLPYKNGMQAALAFKPEMAGRKVKLIILDDGSDPSAAARNARKLVDEEKVDVLMGDSGAPSAVAMAQVARESSVPMVGLTPLPLDPAENKWTITVAQPAQLMIDAVVQRMKKDGVKTVGYIGFNDAWGDLVYEALTATAPAAGIKIVNNERYARPDSSVTGQVLKTMALKPDAVMNGGAGTPGALPFLTLAERGYKGRIYGSHALVNPDFVRVAGAAAEGVILPTGPVVVAEQLPASSPVKKTALEFRAIYEKTNGVATQDIFSATSFDAWLVLADAAGRAKGESGTPEFRKSLRDALDTTKEVVGSQGVYGFKPGQLYGVDERARVLVTLEKGRWKLLP